MRKKKYEFCLPDSTMVDMVITKGNKCKIEQMTLGAAKRMKRVKGFRYQHFQIGFHTFVDNVK